MDTTNSKKLPLRTFVHEGGDKIESFKTYHFGKSGTLEECKNVTLPMYCKIQCIGYGDKLAAIISAPDQSGAQEIVTMSNHETPTIRKVDFIRPLSEKFGIGTYYFDSLETWDESEVLPYIEKAKAAVIEANTKREEAEVIRQKNILIGKKLFAENKPDDAIGVIIANYKQDESDSQSDYFGSSVKKTVVIGWTSKKREDFNEMRKAAANCPIPEINKFSVKPEKPADGGDYWTPEDEHRENYSMGAGTYLGDYKNSNGINIKKVTYLDFNNCPDLWASAGQENGFFAFKTAAEDTKEASTENYTKVEVTAGEVQIIDYSEKAIAVIGDTKPIKDVLKSLGGRFNFRLSCGPGWVFPKSSLQKIQKALNGGNDPEPTEPEPDNTPEPPTKTEYIETPAEVTQKLLMPPVFITSKTKKI